MVPSYQKPIIIASIFHQILCFFPTLLPETIFGGSKRQPILKTKFWEGFSIFHASENQPLELYFRPKRVKRRGRDSEQELPCRDPAFHETIVVTEPLGPTDFEKVVLGGSG